MFFPVLTVVGIAMNPVIPAIFPLFASVVQVTIICQHLEVCASYVPLEDIVWQKIQTVVAFLAQLSAPRALTSLFLA
jgi:hypothetical protein